VGNDIRDASKQLCTILAKMEVIAVDQDPAGMQGSRGVDNGDQGVWTKPLCRQDGPENAVPLFNRSGGTAGIIVSFGDIGLSGSAAIRDLWARRDLGEHQDPYSASMPSRGVVMLKIVAADG
jgi:alpha-galactosidase